MTAPSSSPRGERAGTPGANRDTEVRWGGEVVIDDGPLIPEPSPPNRAARRAVARAARRRTR